MGVSCFNRSGNPFKHACAIGHDVKIAEAQDAKASGFDSRATSGVSSLLAVGKVLPAIELDYQFGSMTHEVRDIIPDWHLPSKAGTGQAMIA